ncbi:ribonuclease toxin immunity protein CdiI [Klebsiella aerogenes]|uniref:ribonuclease toxin immunity protein CdiI n=1 Tax=Klebsiella aerogenes TaxID=548 RepID=UPI00115D0DC3|nr:ribonuclease toxin immunity protein CdiI [Klebsiella aerogenes]HEA8291257.1 ribonuclease toxin immunity protein CdiI [Klebsiella pneumoniae]
MSIEANNGKKSFSRHDVDAGLNLIILSYFDRMHSYGVFWGAISLLVQRDVLSNDGAYCKFSDMADSYKEELFENVEFAM